MVFNKELILKRMDVHLRVIYTIGCHHLKELVEIHSRIQLTHTYSTVLINFNADRFRLMALSKKST